MTNPARIPPIAPENFTDELFRDQRISDFSWSKLAENYSQDQLMEIVFLAGCYLTMSMLTKSFGIQLLSPILSALTR